MADIPINAVTRRVQFTGNTGLGPFAFTFEILANTDIAVYKNATLLTLTTDYTVTINVNGTGSVTLTGSGSGTALVSSDYLTIIGNKALARTTDFTTAGDLLASALNDQLDANVIMTQQLDERVDRALRQDPNDVDGDMTIPAKADRLNKILRFNATTGNPEVITLASGATSAANVSFTQAGAGAVETTVDAKLNESVSVKDFGATGDGTTDDTAAIQAAIDNAVSSGIYRVYFPKGNYRTVNTVGPSTEVFNLIFYGDGLQASTITADHLNGPAVTFNRSQSGMLDMSVNASATRKAGAAGSGSTANSGIYMEPADIAGKAIASMIFERVRVLDHPANGFVQVGHNQLSRFVSCLAEGNGQHGYVFDSGTLSGRTNKLYTGLVIMDTCWSYENTGHGLVIGNPSDSAAYGNTRFLMLNCEFADNAIAAGTRYEAEDSWIRCENVTFLNCAFGGNIVPSPQIGDIFFMGRNLQIKNQRSVQRGHTLRLGVDAVTPDTYGIEINGLRVLNVAQDPVIKVSDTDIDNGDVRGIVVNTFGATDNMTTLISGPSASGNNVSGVIWDEYPPVQTAIIPGAANTTSQSFTNSTTLTDITGLSVNLLPNQTVSFEAQIRCNADPSGDLKLAVAGPSGSTIRWQNTGSIYIAANDSITVSSSDITESGSRTFGAVTGTRIVSFVGVITVGSTAGPIKIQGAQGTSNATPTNIGCGSYLKVIRDNIL